MDITFEGSFVATTRFTQESYDCILQWKKDNNWDGCVYPSMTKISNKVRIHNPVCVIEMDNTNNKTIGMGIINNVPESERKKIFTGNYEKHNTFHYKSNSSYSREDIMKMDDGEYVLQVLDQKLFKGYKHQKRLNGIKLLKPELILCDFEKSKPKQRCSVCGEFKKGHKCKGPVSKQVLKEKLNKKERNRCPYCGKHNKGHFCEKLKRDPERLKKVSNFIKRLIDKHNIDTKDKYTKSNIIVSKVAIEELSSEISEVSETPIHNIKISHDEQRTQ
tara:strand:+ start:39 stop:863 length:825 start_codon:yes stop_codon:yes gene_type:complete